MVGSQVDRSAIEEALAAITGADLPAEAEVLLGTLGYRSERRLEGQTGSVDGFFSLFEEQDPGTQSRQALRENAASLRILFQVTDEEIKQAARELEPERQLPMMDGSGDGPGFDGGNLSSFLFAAVELTGGSYPRGRYAQFTREINKPFAGAPAVVLFRTADGLLTIAFAHVRPNKRNEDRDVLGKVSLVREINPADLHRAHLDILAELALPDRLGWMRMHGKPSNFDGLLAAWLDTLDTEELNRRFYRDLFAWFQRVVSEAQFPVDVPQAQSAEDHVIRLITRMMFVWFIKEKGLIAEDLFIEAQVHGLLKDYDAATGDSYYRAVLQNLFFATLNTEIRQRGFSRRTRATYRDFSCYRYRDHMVDSDELLTLFNQTPFINGGLFDCLDSERSIREAGKEAAYRIDCFTDNTEERVGFSIPNRLFFDDAGLITIFNRYKFTVEENTPIEQEVALDPELLGKAFENLLAANNPETRENVRKQTGSFYTPREVVDYMVDEALVASLAAKTQPDDGDATFWQERIRYLLDYADAGDLFTGVETDSLVRAIAELRVLDPAVGSGAFPMSVLHKLTLALRRLDPDNFRWEALQRELAGKQATAAFHVPDQKDRDAQLDDISAAFERYHEPDFGRKLYLIQNSIYGVDIQPVACQIAKLRFFISLAIEQNATSDARNNYGIHPLPNLETRFVAADSLLSLEKPEQMTLGQTDTVTSLEQQLAANRERHFHASNRREKVERRRTDEKLREQLADALEDAHFSAGDAYKVAQWDPYDQNTHADWFDAEYMFGIAEGFDVVIGNPPYVQLQKEGGKLGQLYQDAGFMTFARTGDIYQLFYERGCQLLKAEGILAYITSNSWLKAEYGKTTRRYFAEKHTPLRLLELGKDVFESAIVDSSVLILRAGGAADSFPGVDLDRLTNKSIPPRNDSWGRVRPDGEAPWSILSPLELSVLDKMRSKGTPLQEWDITIYRGITTGLNEAFIVDNKTKEKLIAHDPKSAEILKPVVRGRDIRRFHVKWNGQWLIAMFPALGLSVEDYPAVKKHLLSFGKERLEQSGKTFANGTKSRKKTGYAWYEIQDTCAYHADFTKEKLLWMDMAPRGRFAYSDEEMYCNDKGFMLTGVDLKYLCAILNSTLITWLVRNDALTTGMGLIQWKKFAVERIPVPQVTLDQQRSFVQVVDRILATRNADLQVDHGEEDAEIDRLVYALYGLTDKEVAAVEERC